MHENTNGLPGALRLDSGNGQGLCMVGGMPVSQVERRSRRASAPADRSDAIRERNEKLDAVRRLAIEYDCLGRVSPCGAERRAVWTELNGLIEALKGVA